ncbi:hypothetical protein [Streptomyces sp. NPDC089795]|uniref:hypothetical protein n=1 Tax=Streptomyces sp. NPDC089795 TaxID=3155297 RepID=UPI003431D190
MSLQLRRRLQQPGQGREVYLVPYGFHCAACDLEVGSKLLIHLGDLNEDVLLDDDPYDYVDDEQPVDEYIIRGR